MSLQSYLWLQTLLCSFAIVQVHSKHVAVYAHNLSLACRKHLTIDVQGLSKDLAEASGDFELLVRCAELPACETWPFTQAFSAAGGCAVDTTHDFMVSNQNKTAVTFHSAPTQPPERLGSQCHNSFCSVGHSFFCIGPSPCEPLQSLCSYTHFVFQKQLMRQT